ncbi:MAG: stage V sporulation protein AA [Wujia sp.]
MSEQAQKKNTIYISLEPSIMVTSKNVHIGDIASVFCSDPAVTHAVSKIELFTFTESEQGQMVVNAIAIIQEIQKQFKEALIQNIAGPETVVYYRNLSSTRKRQGLYKSIFLMLLAFFGTAYSIMSYNGDVGAVDLLQDLYFMFTGMHAENGTTGYTFGILSYCLGLFLGMLVFFNHGINHKETDDPTPLQVQMRLYERDVNDTIVVDSTRKGKSFDVD